MVRLARGENSLQYSISFFLKEFRGDALPNLVYCGVLDVNLGQAIIFLNKLRYVFEVLLRIEPAVPILASLLHVLHRGLQQLRLEIVIV